MAPRPPSPSLVSLASFVAGLMLFATQLANAAPPDAAVNAHKEGLRLAKNNLVPEALESLEKAVKIDPSYAEAWADLGNTHLSAGSLDEAIKAFDAAVRLRPEFQIARYNLAYSLRKTSQFSRAAEQYRLYLQRDPQDADAHYGLAESLKAAGEGLAAAEAYEEYARVERRPGQAKWIQKAEEMAKTLRASSPKPKAPIAAITPARKTTAAPVAPVTTPPAREEQAAKPEATDHEEQVAASAEEKQAAGTVRVGARPEAFEAGLTSLKQGDYQGALARLTVAVKEAPRDALVLAALAGAHLGLEHGPEAEATYRRALAGASPDAVPAIYFGIGEALRFQGEKTKARETYELAMKQEAASAALKKLLTERIDAMK